MFARTVARLAAIFVGVTTAAASQVAMGQCGLTPVLPADASSLTDYGAGVAIDGDTLLVTQRLAVAGRSGTVYIFERAETGWTQVEKLTSPVGETDWFGYSIAVSGNYLVVGAPDFRGGTLAGKAYVYERRPPGWVYQSTLVAGLGSPPDSFGESVAVDGDYIVVGSFWYSRGYGRCWVFHREPSGWVEQDSLSPWSAGPGYEAGRSVGISGDWIIFGVPKADSVDSPYYDNAGVVYLAQRNGATWPVSERLTSSAPYRDEQFGFSVAISGNVALIGTRSGNTVSVHEYDGADWSRLGEIRSADHESGYGFGRGVAIDGDWVSVGAYGKSDTGIASGAAYIFRRAGLYTWTQEVKIVIPGAGDYTMVGYGVDISATEAVVGAPAFVSVDPGAAYVVSVDSLGYGDFDGDSFISANDYIDFEACLAGPGGDGVGAECACADFTANGRIDLADFAGFQAAFTGEP